MKFLVLIIWLICFPLSKTLIRNLMIKRELMIAEHLMESKAERYEFGTDFYRDFCIERIIWIAVAALIFFAY